MRTQDPTQVLTLEEHLKAVSRLDPQVLDDLRTLAVQLAGVSVLPLIGAGGSYDCGMQLASKLGQELLDAYRADSSLTPDASLPPDLGKVAERIYLQRGQSEVVRKLGLPDPALWPAAGDIDDHFCGYRVLARLVRERLYDDTISLNYDCAHEAALVGEGFLLAPDVKAGRRWLDHATVMADAQMGASVARKGSFTLRKIHGCAERYRSEIARNPACGAEDAIVVRQTQLTNWIDRSWAHDRLRQGVQDHVLLTIGFSGQDAIITGALTDKFHQIHQVVPATGEPRVIVIDPNPSTTELDALRHASRGGVPLAADAVEAIPTPRSTITAALLVLLAETLAHHLEPDFTTHGYAPPADVHGRLAALVLAAPVMLRWSYLLRPREDGHHLQRVNLHAAAERGYVPLVEDPVTTARALRVRAELRGKLGKAPEETPEEALEHHGFVVDGSHSVAYLPTGLPGEVLEQACRGGGPLSAARATLPSPSVDGILVSDDGRGFTVEKGAEVPLP